MKHISEVLKGVIADLRKKSHAWQRERARVSLVDLKKSPELKGKIDKIFKEECPMCEGTGYKYMRFSPAPQLPTPEELQPYAGKQVAIDMNTGKIVASAETFEGIYDLLKKMYCGKIPHNILIDPVPE